MQEIRKKLSEIGRIEWIGMNWLEEVALGEEERIFVSNGYRTPDEAAQAMDDWDSTISERRACYAEQEHNNNSEPNPQS